MDINMVQGSKSSNDTPNWILWTFQLFAQNFGNAIFEFIRNMTRTADFVYILTKFCEIVLLSQC